MKLPPEELKKEPISRFPFSVGEEGNSCPGAELSFTTSFLVQALRANGEHEFSAEVLTTPDCAAGFGAGLDLHCVRSFI